MHGDQRPNQNYSKEIITNKCHKSYGYSLLQCSIDIQSNGRAHRGKVGVTNL